MPLREADDSFRAQGCRPLLRAMIFALRGFWSSATLHPRLYAIARYRGLLNASGISATV